jgi:hyperosmotically inducible protein
MRYTIFSKFTFAAAVLGVGMALSTAGAATNDTVSATDAGIAKKLTHEIRMYPRYGIFDSISFSVEEGRVELLGAVSEPFKKTDLGRIAQRVAGVTSLSNEIKVLAPSPMDNRLRVQVARAIYRDPVLLRYGMQAAPPIHIIVDNGHVTLEGAVSTDMEKSVAGLRAAAAGLSLGQVTNNLHVENPSHKS